MPIMTKDEYIEALTAECKKLDESKDYTREINHFANVLWEPDKDMSPEVDAEFMVVALPNITITRIGEGYG